MLTLSRSVEGLGIRSPTGHITWTTTTLRSWLTNAAAKGQPNPLRYMVVEEPATRIKTRSCRP